MNSAVVAKKAAWPWPPAEAPGRATTILVASLSGAAVPARWARST